MKRLFALLLLLVGVPAAAQERITSFDSQLSIRKDGTLDVTETIDVVSEGQRIQHGIYRDLPTRYRLPRGGLKKVRFQLVGTERDGAAEPSKVESLKGGVRIKIGDADRLVETGPHRYVIRYSVTREIGRFDGFDELYWNVTGNGWIFPIEKASATITLPSPVRFGQRATYTGAKGATGTMARVVSEAPGSVSFETTAPLSSYEGMTVAAAFPKGTVDAPSTTESLGWWLTDFIPLVIGGLGLLGTAAFVLFAWNRVGRDPAAGTVVPLFSPPGGMEPAAVRYLEEMGFDNRAFAAALVDLGVRGHVKISEETGGFFSGTKKFIERTGSPAPLSGVEQAALDELIGPSGVVEMDRENHEKFSTANALFAKDLKDRFDGKMFNRNFGWAGAAFAIMAAASWLAATVYMIAQGSNVGAMAVFAIGAVLCGGMLLVLASRSQASGKCLFGALGVLLLGGGFLGGAPMMIRALEAGGALPVLLPLVALPIVLLGFWLMPAPTREGRAMLDRIAGFKQYLSITEGERLDRMTAPTETLELFEKYLPYAIALEVENRWADRFAAQIAAASVAQQGSAFGWYSGSHSPWTDIGGFTGDISDSLSSSLATASTAPGSSGGGSSGGGGGGGGGGGW